MIQHCAWCNLDIPGGTEEMNAHCRTPQHILTKAEMRGKGFMNVAENDTRRARQLDRRVTRNEC